MKDLKKQVVMKELSKEEAAKTYGGASSSYIYWIVEDGQIVWIKG